MSTYRCVTMGILFFISLSLPMPQALAQDPCDKLAEFTRVAGAFQNQVRNSTNIALVNARDEITAKVGEATTFRLSFPARSSEMLRVARVFGLDLVINDPTLVTSDELVTFVRRLMGQGLRVTIHNTGTLNAAVKTIVVEGTKGIFDPCPPPTELGGPMLSELEDAAKDQFGTNWAFVPLVSTIVLTIVLTMLFWRRRIAWPLR